MEDAGIEIRRLVVDLAASPDGFWWAVLALGLAMGIAPASATAYARFREGRPRPARRPARDS